VVFFASSRTASPVSSGRPVIEQIVTIQAGWVLRVGWRGDLTGAGAKVSAPAVAAALQEAPVFRRWMPRACSAMSRSVYDPRPDRRSALEADGLHHRPPNFSR
jgi:hypothetical protein